MNYPKMIVKCKDDLQAMLTEGEEYDVEYRTGAYLWVKNDDDEVFGYDIERFDVVQEGLTTTQMPHVKNNCEVVEERALAVKSPNKYSREIKSGVFVDVYDVIRAFAVTDPCLQHLLKKALATGQRGHKDVKEDLNDILASAKRAVEMYEEWYKSKQK